MKIKTLRRALEGIPDDWDVIAVYDGGEGIDDRVDTVALPELQRFYVRADPDVDGDDKEDINAP